MKHLIYKLNNGYGEFIGTLTCPDFLVQAHADTMPNWQYLLEYMDIDYENCYYDINTVKLRPEFQFVYNGLQITANGEDTFIMTNLPALPCKITIEDIGEFETSDGEFGFPTSIPGIYKIKIECFPYITKELEVTAV
jgi:hypothetical protein